MASTNARSRAELAFLPAALEIVETPPSPVGRAIAITVIAVTCLAVAWASLGTVDIVSIAPGKIIPTGRTKLVQPLEPGIVRAIHVRDGQRVRAGDVLIELDPTASTAELGRLTGELTAAQLDAARLRAALAAGAPAFPASSPTPQPKQAELHRGSAPPPRGKDQEAQLGLDRPAEKA